MPVAQLLIGQRGQIGVGSAERLSGARIKGRHTAAREIVVNLGAHGGGRGRRGGGLVAKRKDSGVGRSGGGPLQARGGSRKECVGLGLIHAGLAAAVSLGAEQGDDLRDRLLNRRIFGSLGRHDAVAVEAGLGKDFGGVGDIRQADGIRRAFTEIAEDALGVGEHRLALGSGGRDGGELDRVRTGEKWVERGQTRGEPGDGAQKLGHADAAVVVGVQQRQRLGVEADAAGGTAQGRPQFLVQTGEIREVVARLQERLVKSAGTEEAPGM